MVVLARSAAAFGVMGGRAERPTLQPTFAVASPNRTANSVQRLSQGRISGPGPVLGRRSLSTAALLGP